MNQTPYDTGDRAQPYPKVAPGNAASLDPAVNPYADDLRENYGRVDFRNDEGETVASIHLSRRDDGGYTVHIIPTDDHATWIEWHGEYPARLLDES